MVRRCKPGEELESEELGKEPNVLIRRKTEGAAGMEWRQFAFKDGSELMEWQENVYKTKNVNYTSPKDKKS